jgi:hypothetical protein
MLPVPNVGPQDKSVQNYIGSQTVPDLSGSAVPYGQAGQYSRSNCGDSPRDGQRKHLLPLSDRPWRRLRKFHSNRFPGVATLH